MSPQSPSKPRRFDLKALPNYAALFQAIQFAHAGSVYFGPIGWLIGAVGGAITNFAIAAATSRLETISEKRRPLANKLILGLFLISPMAIAPAAYISADRVTLTWVRIMVAIVWAMLPDLSIGLIGAITGKGLVFSSNDAQPTRNQGQGTGKPKKQKKQVAPKPATDAEILAYCQQHASDPGGVSYSAAASHFHVSRTAITKRIKKLYKVAPQPQGANVP